MAGRFMFRVGSMALVVGLLSGCQSLMYGTQYEFPKADEPSARLLMEHPLYTSVSILNRNEEGCYAGITGVPYKDRDIDAPLVPGKETIFLYRQEVGGKVCQLHFALTPEANATYLLKSGDWSKTEKGLFGYTHEQGYCGVAVLKKLGEKVSVEPAPQMVIDRGITCHKFVKRKR
ncbi:MAG: hypothetical protein AAGC84_10715 [Pseudomonas sp.]